MPIQETEWGCEEGEVHQVNLKGQHLKSVCFVVVADVALGSD